MKYSPVTGVIAFEQLANALNNDETILKLIEGSYQNSLGLIIATDLRIFYIGINRFNKSVLQQINYDELISILITEPKIISVEIIMHSKNLQPIMVKGCDFNEGKQFVELIKLLTLYNSVSHAK